jgi:hypothetical protein
MYGLIRTIWKLPFKNKKIICVIDRLSELSRKEYILSKEIFSLIEEDLMINLEGFSAFSAITKYTMILIVIIPMAEMKTYYLKNLYGNLLITSATFKSTMGCPVWISPGGLPTS